MDSKEEQLLYSLIRNQEIIIKNQTSIINELKISNKLKSIDLHKKYESIRRVTDDVDRVMNPTSKRIQLENYL